MDITVTFPGGKRVDAAFGGHVVHTDQSPQHGGEGTAPEPFELFLASMASCAGIYVLAFCQARHIPTDGIRVEQSSQLEAETGRLASVELVVVLPETFPEKYREAVVRAADGCRVKKTLLAPPEVRVSARVGPQA